MRVFGLFSGIGGMELGFQREGFEVISVCEIDSYCQKVLMRHFPKALLFEDVRSYSWADFPAKISRSQEGRSDSVASEAASGGNLEESLRRSAQTGLSLRTWDTHGAVGCPKCAETLHHNYMPVCLYGCEPLTWERPTNARVSGLLPTPTASSYGSCRGGGAGRVGKWRKSLDGLGIKNPTYREWMMGFPLEWTAVEQSETQSCRKSPSSLRRGLKRSKRR